MSQNRGSNETLVLLLTLAVTVGLVGVIFWWLTSNHYFNRGTFTNNSSQQSGQPNIQTFAQVSNVPAGLFSYGGSTTWAPIRKEADPAIQAAQPQFQLRYTQPTTQSPGSGTGIKMLLNNQLAFSQSSRSVTPQEYQQAQQLGFKLKEIPVAIDAIAVAVNPNLNIPGLTLAQLKDIYIGKISNWQAVGGPNVPIVPYTRRMEDSGTVEFFHDNVLAGENFSANVQFIPTTTQALREVGKSLGSIYYASATEVVPQCGIKPLPLGREANQFVPPYKEPFVPTSQCGQQRNQLNGSAIQSDQYPVTRRLFVITKENNQTEQKAGEAYANLLLTNQGQESIVKSGFVRIR